MTEDLMQSLDPPMSDAEAEARMAGIRYMQSMTPAERLERNDVARRIINELDAIAAKHGIRSIGWLITGPPDVR